MDTDEADLFQQFISNRFVLIPKIISSKLLTQVSADIDDVLGGNPPESGAVGPYFLPINKPESLIPLLFQTSVFALAESIVGKGKLLVPEQVQLALNIPYFPHNIVALFRTDRAPTPVDPFYDHVLRVRTYREGVQ